MIKDKEEGYGYVKEGRAGDWCNSGQGEVVDPLLRHLT